MKKILSTLFLSLLLCQVAFANFSDVDSSTYYNGAIDWMTDNAILQGYPDGSFQPDRCVNRVEFLKILFETNETPLITVAENPFPDVDETSWYAPYVLTGYHQENQTIEGYPDGSFEPEQCVNRVEAIKMATLEFHNGEIPPVAGLYINGYDIAKALTDNPDEWWKEYYSSARGANTVGIDHFDRYDTEESTTYDFGPGESMTRKEVAEMIYRMKSNNDSGKTWYDGDAPDYIVTRFDGCGRLSTYGGNSWFNSLNELYNEEFLVPQGLSGTVGGEFGEGCLALDGSQFIFIPDYSEFGCGKVFGYDTEENILSIPSAGHCATEFLERVGNYVLFTGWQSEGTQCKHYDGKYYHMDNKIEVETSSC
mgnify:CR=1 FL=1